MAEQMVVAARWRGAKASIYRLPFVGASSSSGHYRLDKGDFLHNLIAGCIGMGCFPSVDTDLGGVLPIDYLAGAVARVMTHDFERIGRDYDFINPKAPSFNEYVEILRAAGCPVESVPYADWHAKALHYAKSDPKGSLARIAAVVEYLTQAGFGHMFDGFPVGRDVFGGEDYPCP